MFFVFFSLAGVASANEPWWHLLSTPHPTYLHPGVEGEIVLTAANVGDATVDGEKGAGGGPVDLSDVLPPGLKAVSVSAHVPDEAVLGSIHFVPLACSLESSSRVSCTLEGKAYNNDGEPVTNAKGEILPKTVPPFDQIEMHIGVVVEAQAPASGVAETAANEVSISGGGAPGASISRPLKLSGEAVPFGVAEYEMTNEELVGQPTRQAGSHPFQTTFTTVLDTSSVLYTSNFGAEPQIPALAKDLTYQTPPGWVGDPSAFEHCTTAQFYIYTCPAGSVVGVTSTTVDEPTTFGVADIVVPLYNLEPEPGQAARFGFFPTAQPVFIDATVRSGRDYGVTTHVENITQIAGFLANETTIWGVPGLAAHDLQRGEGCLQEARGDVEGEMGTLGKVISCRPAEPRPHPPAFLSLPTSCTPAPQSTLAADSWAQPQPANPEGEPLFATSLLPALDGCNELPFTPSIEVKPDVKEASKPSGLEVDVHVPQSETLNAEGLAEADPKNIVVTLPEGMQLNPSAADGLQACTEHEIGYTGNKKLNPITEPEVETPQFEPELFNPATGKDEVTLCPSSAKIATATVHTPLLPNTLEGAVYLAAPQNFREGPPENPFSALVAMYLVVKDPVSGVIVKLAGSVELGGELNPNPALTGLQPGQIRATFDQSPQAPFEDAILHFFGGERAPLATPALCRRQGEAGYQTLASFTPWTAAPGEAPRDSTSEFNINSGPGGGACPNPPGDQSSGSLPFAASLSSETTNINAGGFTPLSTTLSRPSGNQNIQSVTLHYPAGLSGLLSGVELCPEPLAGEGKCGPNSQIGETIVSVGVGGDPFTVTGGKVYITGPFNGTGTCAVGTSGCAPFGLSIVNPAKAGPFDLQQGEPVVVRAKIEVNPSTAALTITTNGASQGHAIPSMIEGFALQIQHVNVLVNRPGFTFNPTSCNPAEITGQVNSAEGASSPVEVPFQVTNCQALKFTPKFAVSTSGKTSKAGGASLTATVSEPAPAAGGGGSGGIGSIGTQANIARVKVELPVQLPSRLTTLQKACIAAQFEANPAGCPGPSVIGHAKVITPLVPVPLEGPVYFVSHGGEAFPSLEMVLQGYGVKIILVGATFISKAGITSTTFKTVPDQPFNTFTITLPEGKYSALAANGNLCKATKTETVKKKVTVKVNGKKKTVTRKVKETVAATLQMPNEFTAQNGAEIHQVTPITVTGCGKTAKVKKAKKKKKAAKKGGKR